MHIGKPSKAEDYLEFKDIKVGELSVLGNVGQKRTRRKFLLRCEKLKTSIVNSAFVDTTL